MLFRLFAKKKERKKLSPHLTPLPRPPTHPTPEEDPARRPLPAMQAAATPADAQIRPDSCHT